MYNGETVFLVSRAGTQSDLPREAAQDPRRIRRFRSNSLETNASPPLNTTRQETEQKKRQASELGRGKRQED